YLAARRPVEAGEAYHRAVRLGGAVPQTWGAYVAYLVRTEPKDRPPALKEVTPDDAIEEAQRQLPPEQAPLVLAHCYTIPGQLDRAEQQYQAALAAKPDDVALLQDIVTFYTRTGQGPKAAPYLEKILAPQTKASPPQVAWARRQQALNLAAQGGYPKIQ